MKMLNQVKITFASRSVNEGFAVRRWQRSLFSLTPPFRNWLTSKLLCPRLSPTVSCTPIRRVSALLP